MSDNLTTRDLGLTSAEGKTLATQEESVGVHALKMNALGIPTVARKVTVGNISYNTALTTTCRRISMTAVGAAIRYSIGAIAQTATTISHYIGEGERLDINLPTTPNIATIRDAAIDGILEISELS